MDLSLLWTIQCAPLAAFLLIQLLPAPLKRSAPLVGIAGALTAAVASLRLFLANTDIHSLPKEFVYNWLFVADHKMWPFVEITDYRLVVGFLVDPVNLLMITLVTVIALFVQIFSYYYMAEDASRARYFGFLSFFSFSMTGLVLSNNLLQTFLFWELVGLTSYLLIGFWYEKQSAGTAARKAFVINRLGDLGFYLGIILLFLLFGTLNFTAMTSEALRAALPASTLTLIALLVFTGVMGKSAQFPFHVWLPDAMEGPTPVSALIHSATMVAAGVFLLVRAFGLFSSTEAALYGILVIGGLTAFVGASLATTQRDIKKIMAYSTVSQLGLMVMAVGAGAPVSGMFHLATHACFKSLLFLTSGAFIHRFHTNDIWEIGRQGGKHEKLSVFMLGFGLLSLCGVFPFAGFFSKDMILESLREKDLFFYAVAVFVSFLTVYYSCRMIFVIWFSKQAHKAHGHAHAHHESALLSFAKALPLVSLAAISLYMGALGTALFDFKILHWLHGHEAHLNIEILITTTLLILGGAGLAFARFKDPEQAEKRLAQGSALQTVLENKFYMDDAYRFLVKKIGLGIAAILDAFDRIAINGWMVNGTSYSILNFGKLTSRLQNGSLQDYLAIVIGIGILIVVLVLS